MKTKAHYNKNKRIRLMVCNRVNLLGNENELMRGIEKFLLKGDLNKLNKK